MSDTRQQTVRDIFSPLPPRAVQLHGFFENDIENVIEHWNLGLIPYERMVEMFRSGRERFATGEMWGKAVRSGAMFYRYNGDARLKATLARTVADLLTTRRENGSISCSPVEEQPDSAGGDLWERKYVLLGLDEYYRQVEADPAVLAAMVAQADAIIAQIGPPPKNAITELGWSPNKLESSTLLEPFMRLYGHTGEQRFLEFARYIVEAGGAQGYNLVQQAADNCDPALMGGPYPKAYEMLSLFEGLADYYRVTGDARVQQAVLNLYRNVSAQELTIIGNGGCTVEGEGWGYTAREQTNPAIERMMETCTGITWLKYCSHLLRLTGQARAMDDIERYAYNGLIGAMKPGGNGFSYVNLLNGSKTTNHGWGAWFDEPAGWVTCCNLNGPMGLAYLPYLAVMQAGEGPVINLFNAASAIAATPAGRAVSLEIATTFPFSGLVKVTVTPEAPEGFLLRLRIPAWSARTALRVNGASHPVTPGAYAEIARDWQPGDVIELELDMRTRLVQSPPRGEDAAGAYQADLHGPIVLARDEQLDPDYNTPVRFIADAQGYIDATPVTPALPHLRMQFSVPTTDGPITMVDYASVDNWNELTHICTWMPIKEK